MCKSTRQAAHRTRSPFPGPSRRLTAGMGKAEIENLKVEIKAKRDAVVDVTLKEKEVPPLPKLTMRNRKTLKGHFAKLYAMHWAEASGSTSR